MKKGKTKSGFTYSVNDKMGDDMELLEALAKLDQGDVTVVPMVLDRILGEKQKRKLYDHVREEDGRVPITRISTELADIFKGDELKKS